MPEFLLKIEDIEERKKIFSDIIEYLDQNMNQKDEVKIPGLMIELNEKNIQINDIDQFKENYYDPVIEYSQIHA